MRHAFISLCQPLKLLNTFFGNVRDGNIYEMIRETFPALMYLYSLMGTIWPSCYLHCGWIIDYYGFDLPDESAQHKTYLFLFSFLSTNSFNLSSDFALQLPDQPCLPSCASNFISAKFLSFVCEFYLFCWQFNPLNATK